MPDRDVFPGLHRSWRNVGRAVSGRQPPQVVGSLAEKALADQLRTDPGSVKLGEAAAAIARTKEVRAMRHVIDLADLQSSPVLRRLETVARASSGFDEHELVERTLARAIQDQLDTLRPKLVGAVFPVAAEATRYLDECAGYVRVQQLADQVMRGTSRIRAPRRVRKSTADLLYESLT